MLGERERLDKKRKTCRERERERERKIKREKTKIEHYISIHSQGYVKIE